MVHEGGFGLEVGAGVKLNFIRPDGEPLHPDLTPNFRGDADDLIAEHAARGLTIDHETCEPDWGGYDMDYDIVLHGLLDSDGLTG